jgi:tetratricopeptide (TPR) repeat protein
MKRALPGLLVVLLAGCTTPLEQGELRYREGDRLGALEIWRAAPESAPDYEETRERIRVVETEFERLVVQYKQRGRYYEARDRLAESVLNYRLALKLQPEDAETLARVQELARALAARKAELRAAYREAFDAGNLSLARTRLETLRTLDPFDHQLETAARDFERAQLDEVARRMEAGRRGFASGNYAAASRAFRAVLELEPDSSSARGYLSYIATIRRESERAGDAPAAFEAPETFATDAQIRAEGFYQNAVAAERNGELYAAIRHDLRALDADPNHAGARRHLALLRGQLAPQVDILIEAGRTAFRQEDLQSALDLWRQALLVDPSNERVIAYIGRAEEQLQNLEQLRSDDEGARSGS